MNIESSMSIIACPQCFQCYYDYDKDIIRCPHSKETPDFCKWRKYDNKGI